MGLPHDEPTVRVIGAALKVHKALGPDGGWVCQANARNQACHCPRRATSLPGLLVSLEFPFTAGLGAAAGFVPSCGPALHADGQHPGPHRQHPAARAQGRAHLRQGRVPESRRQHQGPRGAGHARGRRARRQAQARLHHRRADLGQHRHRHRAGRPAQGLPGRDRDARGHERGAQEAHPRARAPS